MKVRCTKTPHKYGLGGEINNHDILSEPSLKKELNIGRKVELEHADTLEYIKNFYSQNKKFPSKEEVANSIVIDHIKDFKDIKNPNSGSYYKGLVNNNLTEEVKKYAIGGALSVNNNTLDNIRGMYVLGGEIPPTDYSTWSDVANRNHSSSFNSDIRGGYISPNYGVTLSGINSDIQNAMNNNVQNTINPNTNTLNGGKDYNIGKVYVNGKNSFIPNYITDFPKPQPLSFDYTINNEPELPNSNDEVPNYRKATKDERLKDNSFKLWLQKQGNKLKNIHFNKLNLNTPELLKTGLSNLGGLYDIYRGLKGGNPESYSRLAPLEIETLNPDRNIAQMKELSNYSRKQMNNVGGQGLGQYLNNLSDLNSNTQKQMANIISNYDQQNVGIRNQNQQLNRDIDAKNIAMDVQQNEINAKERDTARNALQHGLTQLGEGFGQQFQDSAQRKAQDFAITSLMEKNNYDYIPDNKGGYIMTSKTDKNKQYRIDIYGNVYDMDGTLLGDKSILNTPTE